MFDANSLVCILFWNTWNCYSTWWCSQ